MLLMIALLLSKTIGTQLARIDAQLIGQPGRRHQDTLSGVA
jgi:hypothetical protein